MSLSPCTSLLVCVACLVLMGACKTTPEATTHEPATHAGSIAEGLDCSNCHTTDGWQMGSARSPDGGFDHSQTGFPLVGQHRHAGCSDCHHAGETIQRACVSCHEDEHQGRLGVQCDQCHSPRGFQITDALALHRRTQFPLTGMHVLADCTECHQRRGERFLSNVPSDCFTCHEQEYRHESTHPSHLGGGGIAPFPRDCSQCHRPIGWVPALIDPATLGRSSALNATTEHDLFFPISTGVHQGSPCETCHVSASAPTLVRCNGCHAHNPVQLQLDHPNQTVAASGSAGSAGSACLGCHPGGLAR